MRPMAKSLGGFRAALLIGWGVLGLAGILYARSRGIPGWAALPVVAAFLIEYPFYLVPAFPSVRERVSGMGVPAFAVAAAVLPYLACCCGAVDFTWSGLARVVAVALVLGLWYGVLPASRITDVAFLALWAAVLLGRYFNPIYAPLHPEFKDLKNIIIVPHLALISMAVMALMLQRRVPETGYGFVPNRREWRIGLLHFGYFVPIGLPLALLLRATHFAAPKPVWYIAATFVGMLCVVSLSEEFFVRGVLQQWIEDWTLEPRRRAARHVGDLRSAPPVDARIPQLEVGPRGRRTRLVLRPRAQPGRQHPRQYGHTRPGGHHVAGLLRVAVQFILYGKIRLFGIGSHGLPDGPQPSARRSRGGVVVQHLRESA